MGPGFTKDEFFKFLTEESVRKNDTNILQNRNKFVLSHVSSGHKGAIEEVLNKPEVQSKLSDVKAIEEAKALEGFWHRLRGDPLRVQYGYKYVKRCSDMNAIDTLLICDSLFRNFGNRRDFVNLCEDVKKNGGKVLQFSSLHVTGQQLLQLTGVASLLRFPIDLENDEEFLSTYPEIADGNGDLSLVDESSSSCNSSEYTTDSDDET